MSRAGPLLLTVFIVAAWRAMLSIETSKKGKDKIKNNENTEKISYNYVITFNSGRYNLYFS